MTPQLAEEIADEVQKFYELLLSFEEKVKMDALALGVTDDRD